MTQNDIVINTVVLGQLIHKLPVSAFPSPSSIDMLFQLLRKAFGAIISIAKTAPRIWRSKVPAQARTNAGVIKASQRSTAFGSLLGSHCGEQRRYLYCGYCDQHFSTLAEAVDHARQHYFSCSLCGIEAHFPTLRLLEEHCRSTEHIRKSGRASVKFPQTPSNVGSLSDHHQTLRVSPFSAHDKIARERKGKRSSFLPDGVKRRGGLTEEQQKTIRGIKATLVGQALDALSEQELCQIAWTVRSQSACPKRSRFIRRIG